MQLKKRILTSGFHFVSDKNGGRKAVYIPPKRIKHWVEQHAKMREDGLNVPAPEYHSDKENPNKYLQRKGSKSNFGFWDSLSVGKDSKGRTTLEGVLDAGLSDATKLGNSVRETSVFSENKFIDGSGKEWDDVLTHIACVTKPIEKGQKNFVPVNDFDQALSMSHGTPTIEQVVMDLEGIGDLVEDEDKTAGDELIGLLRDVAGVALPDNCDMQNFQAYLLVALKQKQLSDEDTVDGGTVDKPPKDAKTNEVPVVMSETNTPAETQTTAETTPESTVDPVIMSQHNGMLNYMESERKSQATQRLNTLVQRGVVDAETQKDYQSQIDAISMSFDDEGKPERSAIEMTLDNLEQVKIPMPANAPVVMSTDGTTVIEPNPTPESGVEMTDEQANAVLTNMFGTTTPAN